MIRQHGGEARREILDRAVYQSSARGEYAGFISLENVLPPGDERLVRRGDSVALVSRRGGVEVRVAGRAMADAGENERVSVENMSSRKIVQGTVAASGDVLVTR